MPMMPPMKNADTRLIIELGGPVKVAKLCGVSRQAVLQWRDNGIPELRRYQIVALLKRQGVQIPAALKAQAA